MKKTEKSTINGNFFAGIITVIILCLLFYIAVASVAAPIAKENISNRLVENISKMRFYKENVKKELSSIDDFKKIMHLDPSMVNGIQYNRFIKGEKDQTLQGDFIDYSTQNITMTISTISTDSYQEYSVATSTDVCATLVDKVLKSSCKYRDENKHLFRVEL
jgi:hypothetical protein